MCSDACHSQVASYQRHQSTTNLNLPRPSDGYRRRRNLMLLFSFRSWHQYYHSSASAFLSLVPLDGRRRCPANLVSIKLPLLALGGNINERGLVALNLEADAAASGNVSLINASQKKKKKEPSAKTLPYFWNNENDECIIITEGRSTDSDRKYDTGGKSVKFTIRGKPLPLVRHRSCRGFMYNPSGAAQEMFRDSLLRVLPQRHHPVIIDDGTSLDTPVTFFSKSEFLEMSIVFRLKRPKSHFVGNKPGSGRIKSNAPGKFHVSRTDIDNLAKFVLDSLNGILYDDDRQVVSLRAIKMLDSEGMCDGATDVTITVLEDEQVNSS
eukprot:CCRYP_000034-RA/>CCRYP_000034-RA protein AED:0.36 eAED:0.36 QI:0/-1/0/1/-1/1/1/0/323